MKTSEELIHELQDEVNRVYPNPTSFIRPKDAATLIILRKNEGKVEIFMGKRHGNHVFMPNVFVFPGGKVDLADSRLKIESELSDKTKQQLLVDMKGRVSENRANAMALAAIRETFEETGYVIGKASDRKHKSKSDGWQKFFDTGFIPAIDHIQFVARAITPPGGKRRYDTRFFAIWQHDIPNQMAQFGEGTDELDSLNWINIEEVESINAPVITKTMIYELQNQIENDGFKQEIMVPFYHYYKNQMRRDEIRVI